MKLQAEIKAIPRLDDRKETVISNRRTMPPYLLFSFYRDGTLSRDEI